MRLDELGQEFIVRLIMRLDELCSVLCLNRHTIDDSSSRRIMRLYV